MDNILHRILHTSGKTINKSYESRRQNSTTFYTNSCNSRTIILHTHETKILHKLYKHSNIIQNLTQTVTTNKHKIHRDDTHANLWNPTQQKRTHNQTQSYTTFYTNPTKNKTKAGSESCKNHANNNTESTHTHKIPQQNMNKNTKISETQHKTYKNNRNSHPNQPNTQNHS